MALTQVKDRGSSKPSFVFIHGGFHGAWTWTETIPHLAAQGYASLAIDLPGAGALTQFPASLNARPLDHERFASEISPLKDVSQHARTLATTSAMQAAAQLGNGKVVLVGHSWGGLSISHAAEALPELTEALVYLTAVVLPNGVAGQAIFAHESFATSEVGPLIIGDPAITGAILRIDPRSTDPDYLAGVRRAFYDDVEPDRIPAIINLLHSDEPALTGQEPMCITEGRFGQVPRHYIRMGDDQALPPAAQDHMVAELDASGIGGVTQVHEMSGSHSPMFAQAAALSEVLIRIATNP